MTDWRTVKIAKMNREAHTEQEEQSLTAWASWAGARIRVKLAKKYNPAAFRKVGCDSYKFYEVCLADSKRIRGDSKLRFICEHYIEEL
jgi:hypothetical protein